MKRYVVVCYLIREKEEPNVFFLKAENEDDALEQAYDCKSLSEAEKEYLRTGEEPEDSEEEIYTDFLDNLGFKVIELTDSLFSGE